MVCAQSSVVSQGGVTVRNTAAVPSKSPPHWWLTCVLALISCLVVLLVSANCRMFATAHPSKSVEGSTQKVLSTCDKIPCNRFLLRGIKCHTPKQADTDVLQKVHSFFERRVLRGSGNTTLDAATLPRTLLIDTIIIKMTPPYISSANGHGICSQTGHHNPTTGHKGFAPLQNNNQVPKPTCYVLPLISRTMKCHNAHVCIHAL